MMATISEKVINFARHVVSCFLVFILTIIFFSTLIFMIILFSPIYFLRFCVSKLRKCGPNLGEIVSTQSTYFAVDGIYTNPKVSVLMCSALDGDSSDAVEFLRKVLLEKLINARNDSGEFTNVEMQQYIFKWMGFFFWRWDESFDISHHVNFYSSPEINENAKVSQAQLRKIEHDLLLKGFYPKRSPWEVLVVRNAESDNGEPRSQIYFRFHHTLADGFSVMKIFFAALIDPGKTTLDKFLTKPRPVKKSIGNLMFLYLKNTLLAPFIFTKFYLDSYDTNKWNKKDNIVKNRVMTTASQKFPVAELKEVAKHYQVGLTAVIFSGFTAAMRKAILKKNGKVPKHIHITVPVPVPGHPNKLTNHLSLVFIQLPVGESGAVERLQKLQKYLDSLKNSPMPAMSFALMPVVGGLLPFMVKFFFSTPITTTLGSSFPGSKQTMYIHDQKILDSHFYIGPCMAHYPVLCNSITYSDGFKLAITTSSAMLEDEADVDQLVDDILEEFCNLKNGHFA